MPQLDVAAADGSSEGVERALVGVPETLDVALGELILDSSLPGHEQDRGTKAFQGLEKLGIFPRSSARFRAASAARN
jgi:hypothetical protein